MTENRETKYPSEGAHQDRRRLHLYGTRALAGLLANPDTADYGNKKIAYLASEYAERLLRERQGKVRGETENHFDLFAGHAIRGLLANPDGLNRGGNWVIGRAFACAEKMAEEASLRDDAPNGALLRRYAANALGGMLARPDNLSYGVSRIIDLSIRQAELTLENM